MWKNSKVFAFFSFLLLALPAVPGKAQIDLDELRDELKQNVSRGSIGAGYAQILNFFIQPDISASVLEADDTDYNVFKVPLQFEKDLNSRDWRLLMRATLSHATAETPVELVSPFKPFDTEWKASSGEVGAGLIIPLDQHWSATVGAEFGISRLENTASYRDELTQAIIAPITDGIIFNWDTNARVASLTGGLGYSRQLADKYDFTVRGRYTYSHIASYSESRDLPSFSADTGTASIKIDLKHPYGTSVAGLPLFGRVHAGGTAFTGSNRDALGFTHFYELGYSVGVDISHFGYKVRSLSLGYQVNTGRDVDGYSILFSWELQ